MSIANLPTLQSADLASRVRPKSEMPSKVDRVLEKQRHEAHIWRDVCLDVDKRDRKTCRACGKHADPDAIGTAKRAHRHHITYRSAGGRHTTKNLVTLDSQCHTDEHHHRLRFTEDGFGYDKLDANQAMSFWRKDSDGNWYLSRRETAPHIVERD